MPHILDVVSGIVEISGEHDTGKTLAGFQTMLNPQGFAFLDGDLKGRELVEQILKTTSLGYYKDITALRNGVALDAQLPLMRQAIKNIPPNMDVIMWDNWKPLYDAARAYVNIHKEEFGAKEYWRGDSSMINGLVSKAARQEEERLLHQMREKARLVVVVSHLADQYLGTKKTGAQVADSSATFDRVCYLRLRLRHNPNSPVPIALVTKRFTKPVFQNGVFDYMSVVPPKLTPYPGEKSVWEVIMRYWHDPVGERALLPEETPTMEEIAMMRGELTQMQKEMWLAQVKYDTAAATPMTPESAADLNPALPPLEEAVKDLYTNGVTVLGEVIAKLREAGYTKLAPPAVSALLKKAGGS